MKTAVPPIALDQVPPEWVAERRAVVVRDGFALRAGSARPTIEVKSLTTNEWCLLTLPGGAREFVDVGDRDTVLRQLWEGVA